MANFGVVPTLMAAPLFYLNPNENPTLILVQPPLTSLLNHHSWCHAVRVALQSMNKLCFIDEVFDVEIAHKGDTFFAAWDQANTMVLSCPHNSISPTIKQSIMWLNTAREVWLDLKRR